MSSWLKRTAIAAVATAAFMGAAAAQVVYHCGNISDPRPSIPTRPRPPPSPYPPGSARGPRRLQRQGRVVPGAAEKGGQRRRQALPLHDPLQRQMVERRPGEGLRLRVLLSPHREPGDRGEVCQHPLPDFERREDRQRAGEGRGTRRQGGRRPDARDQAREADALLSSFTHQTSLPVHPASVQKHGKDFVTRQLRFERRLRAHRVRAELVCEGHQEPAFPRCAERQDRRRGLLPAPGSRGRRTAARRASSTPWTIFRLTR